MPEPTIWTPPKTGYRFRSPVGRVTALVDITRVEFAPRHVVFWRGDDLVLAENANSVYRLEPLKGDPEGDDPS